MNIYSGKLIHNGGDVYLWSFFSSLLHAGAQTLSKVPSDWVLTDHLPSQLGTRAAARAALAPKAHGKLHRTEWPSRHLSLGSCGLWLCLFSLVISLVYASPLAMVNKYPLKGLCRWVKGSSLAEWGIHSLRSLHLAPATTRRKHQFLKEDRYFDPEAAIALQGRLIRVPLCYKH